MLRIADCFDAEFDPYLVLIAGVICALGACATVVAAGRVHADTGGMLWRALLAVCATSTVWATHFVAMLAWRTDIPISYALLPTLASYLVGLAVGGTALALAPRLAAHGKPLAHGLGFGVGVAALHYVGMSAVRVPGRLLFDPWLVAASVAASCALGMLTVHRLHAIRGWRDWGVAVLLFALTVLVLHFLGMSAVTVTLGGPPPTPGLSRDALVTGATAAALSVALITLFGASFDKRLALRVALEAARFRALADAAVEALIIHRDGVVLDSNVAARRLLGLAGDTPIALASLFPPGGLPTADDQELDMLRRDGARVPVEIHRRPILAADASAAELLAIRDLSAKKAAERRLAAALEDVGRLRDLIPMCAWCKKVRTDAGFWSSVEEHLTRVTGHDITHGVCPECHARVLAQMQR
ncbi:MAG: MHYT domain-containing protein [Gammaproteobacteria bacterium]